jgi:hypothetical protein
MLESRTLLDRLQARGTVRIAMKAAGLDPAAVAPHQMGIVVERLLPAELRARGIASPESICAELRGALEALPADGQAETPEKVFARLGGRV